MYAIRSYYDLVKTFEICHLFRISCFDKSFETSLDQCRYTTAQNRLLTEKVSFSFIFESRFDDCSSTTTDS